MIHVFENWLRFEKRSSKHTISSYLNDLYQFETFLEQMWPGTPIESAGTNMLKSWVVSLMDNGLSPSTVQRKIVTLNTFYKFLIKESKITRNPAYGIQAPKKPRRIVKYLEEEEIISILDQMTFENDFWGMRDRLIIEMLYGTGIRLSELLGLKSSSIDFSSGIIKVLGKRSKERIIPLNHTLKEMLPVYTRQSEEYKGGKSGGSLFFTEKGQAAYPMMIYRIVKKYVDQLIGRTHVSPHVLRHTFATHLINRGADINAIKELLGHANLAATQIYTHTSVERLKKVYKQAHPRG